MRNLTIAIDFDGTLCENKYPDIGAPKQAVIDAARELKKQGHYIILNTCRHGEDLTAAVLWCKLQGLVFDAVNENDPKLISLFGESRKIGADFYIDDKNLSIEQFISLPLVVSALSKRLKS